MKRFILLVTSVLMLLACTEKPATPAVDLDELDNKLKTAVEDTLRARGVDVEIAVERMGQLDSVPNFYFYKLIVTANGNSQEQFVFFDGKYLTSEFVEVATNIPASKMLIFENASYDVDVSKLSLAHGKPDAPNVIVEITDFECPYCRSAYTYLEEKLKNRDDVAVYIAHLPLQIHKNAEISARIFEAGLLMGHNFQADLFTGSEVKHGQIVELVLDYTPDELAAYFAEKSGDADKFMKLLYSDEVTAKLQSSMEIVNKLDMSSTPSFVINGKRIEGLDRQLIDKALGF